MIFTDERREELTRQFQELGIEGLAYNQYELAENCEEEDPQIWKAFLMEPATAAYIRNEMDLIRTSQLNKMVQESAKSRSVGQSQLMNALLKMDDNASRKEGPTFIYCYVPLSEEQQFAPNIVNCNSEGIQITNEGVIILEDT